jgi:hypothetical protein
MELRKNVTKNYEMSALQANYYVLFEVNSVCFLTVDNYMIQNMMLPWFSSVNPLILSLAEIKYVTSVLQMFLKLKYSQKLTIMQECVKRHNRR